MSFSILIKQSNQPRRVFAIHHVNNEDNVGFAQSVLNVSPFSVGERRAKVVRGNMQIQSVFTINLAFRVSERSQQA